MYCSSNVDNNARYHNMDSTDWRLTPLILSPSMSWFTHYVVILCVWLLLPSGFVSLSFIHYEFELSKTLNLGRCIKPHIKPALDLRALVLYSLCEGCLMPVAHCWEVAHLKCRRFCRNHGARQCGVTCNPMGILLIAWLFWSHVLIVVRYILLPVCGGWRRDSFSRWPWL